MNNASSFFPIAVGAIEASHWEELIGSNLRAPLFLAQEAAPELAKARGRDRQHRRHPRRAAAEGLSGLQHRQGRARGADALARARARAARCASTASRPGAIAWPEDGQFDRRRARAHRRHHAARAHRHARRTSRRRYTSSLRALRHRPDPGGGRRALHLPLGTQWPGCGSPSRGCLKSSGPSA